MRYTANLRPFAGNSVVADGLAAILDTCRADCGSDMGEFNTKPTNEEKKLNYLLTFIWCLLNPFFIIQYFLHFFEIIFYCRRQES